MRSANGAPPGFKPTPYDQVVNTVSSRFPHLNREQIDNALIAIRKFSGNLRRYTIATLIDTLCERFASSSGYASNGQPATASASYAPAADGDLCAICHLLLLDGVTPIDQLECGHHYHAQCIRPWFNENKTCPQCRSYSLLPDEYPTLGR